MLKLKEALDDPSVERQIQEILVPQEFTRLDRIVDLVFATAEDAQAGTEETVSGEPPTTVEDQPSRADFHNEIVAKLEKQIGKPLVRQSRVLWSSPDDQVLVSCQVSKEYGEGTTHYWFGLKRSTKTTLEKHGEARCAFGLGSSRLTVLLPYAVIAQALPLCSVSTDAEGQIIHWHIRFTRKGSHVKLVLNDQPGEINVSKYLI